MSVEKKHKLIFFYTFLIQPPSRSCRGAVCTYFKTLSFQLLKSGGLTVVQSFLSLIDHFLVTCLQVLLAQFVIQSVELILRAHGQLITLLSVQIIQSLIVLGYCINRGCEQTVRVSLACFVDSNLSVIVSQNLVIEVIVGKVDNQDASFSIEPRVLTAVTAHQ